MNKKDKTMPSNEDKKDPPSKTENEATEPKLPEGVFTLEELIDSLSPEVQRELKGITDRKT